MSGWDVFTRTWTWDPSVVLGCVAALVIYWRLTHFRPARQAAYFVVAIVVLFLSLASPLDELGDGYLFSAHMLQHLLMLLVFCPLVILGIPADLWRRLLAWGPAGAAERVLGRPVLAWLIGVATLWVWHVPALYNAALESEGVHVVQHLSFLVTGCIFWWPVIAPLKDESEAPLGGMAYLFAGSLSSALLGMWLTFSEPGLYPAYLHPHDDLGLLAIIRGEWGISAAADQSLGGLLMWVPGSLVYLVGILALLGRWYSSPEQVYEYEEPAQESSVVSGQ